MTVARALEASISYPSPATRSTLNSASPSLPSPLCVGKALVTADDPEAIVWVKPPRVLSYTALPVSVWPTLTWRDSPVCPL